MNRKLFTRPLRRKALALTALAGSILAGSLAYGPDEAMAATKATVKAGTLRITGDAASNHVVLRLQSGSPTTLQIDVGADGTADFSFDRSRFTAIDVQAGSGNDVVRVDQSAGAFADEAITMSGGDGADTLLGGSGAETLLGGRGDDVVAGGDGNDRAELGGGNDTFTWSPGDDNDTVEGQGGTNDRLDFNGSSIGELIDISANGGRVRFTRNIANIAMDLDGVEWLAFHAFGGPDTIVVNDLGGTGVRTADIDLNAAGGGGGDGQPDTVVARGTEGADTVSLSSPGGYATVSGLSAEVLVESAESAYDDLNVQTLGGDDTIGTGREVFGPASINVDAGDGHDVTQFSGTDLADTIDVVANGTEVSTVAPLAARLDTTAVESLVVLGLAGTDTISAVGNLAPLTALTIDGGDGQDRLSGGNGPDLLLGGADDDTIDGQQGADRAFLGGGDDRFQWDPGDGNDTVEGQDGTDLLDFFGSSIGELIDISANGGRVRFTRNIATVVTDLNEVERVGYHASGGADAILVNDLSGTDATTVELDLNAFGGTGDTQADVITVKGTDSADLVDVGSTEGRVLIGGLAAETRITGSEAAYDTLRVETFGGNDAVTVAPYVNDLIATIVDLGADD